MMKPLILLAALLLSLQATPAFAQKIYLFPTLHRLHLENQRYSYDSLREMIRKLRPDIIAVEIRAEDIGADTAYLKKNYPLEMWMSPYWFPQCRIEGIDWLGEDIEGRPVPADYWQKGSRVKQVERQLHQDAAYTARLRRCDSALDQRMALLRGSSLLALLQGEYFRLTDAYYQCLEQQLSQTPYAYLPEFYERRNQELAKRCATIIMSHPGKTLVILTGADHYGYLHRYLTAHGVALSGPGER